MHAALQFPVAPNAPSASALAALFVDEYEQDAPRVAIPRAEVQLVARFDASARGSVDVHALGARLEAHRKHIRGGQRAVTARLRLGTQEAVLGVPAAWLAGCIVPLGELWGEVAARRLTDRLASSSSTSDAVAIIDRAIAERLARRDARDDHARLVHEAAKRLAVARVSTVAGDLGLSERNFRRIFREAVGMGPKAFSKLARFHRALAAAQKSSHVDWADIAIASGYYDQPHLIAEFREIAGVAPRALLGELRGAALTVA